MNILIVGCGKVGSGLANTLDRMGHVVSIVDRDAQSFARLDDSFSGFCLAGIPIDTEVLCRAGIEGCDFLVSVVGDDNTNIMVCQIARQLFHVPKVLARIYDPDRREIFAQFGIHTICPTSLTVDVIEKIIRPEAEESVPLTFGGANMSLSSLMVPKAFYGRQLDEVPHNPDETAVAVLHGDGSVTLRGSQPGLRLTRGDRILCLKLL